MPFFVVVWVLVPKELLIGIGKCLAVLANYVTILSVISRLVSRETQTMMQSAPHWLVLRPHGETVPSQAPLRARRGEGIRPALPHLQICRSPASLSNDARMSPPLKTMSVQIEKILLTHPTAEKHSLMLKLINIKKNLERIKIAIVVDTD